MTTNDLLVVDALLSDVKDRYDVSDVGEAMELFAIEQLINQLVAFLESGVGEKGFKLLAIWQAAGDVERQAAEEFFIAAKLRRLNEKLLELFVN